MIDPAGIKFLVKPNEKSSAKSSITLLTSAGQKRKLMNKLKKKLQWASEKEEKIWRVWEDEDIKVNSSA